MNSVEHLFVLVKFPNNDQIVIGNCYIPPASPISCYENNIRAIEYVISKVSDNTRFILVGDYNLPNVRIASDYNGLNYVGNHTDQSELIVNKFSFFGFYQLNSFCNKYGSQLDLIFTYDNTLSVELGDIHLVPMDEYHPILYLSSFVNKNGIVSISLLIERFNYMKLRKL